MDKFKSDQEILKELMNKLNTKIIKDIVMEIGDVEVWPRTPKSLTIKQREEMKRYWYAPALAAIHLEPKDTYEMSVK